VAARLLFEHLDPSTGPDFCLRKRHPTGDVVGTEDSRPGPPLPRYR